jgi:flagellar biosynthesis regulator FlbT
MAAKHHPYVCINPPGAFDPSEEWRKHLDELLAMAEREEVQDAIADARKGLARSEALEEETRKRLALERELRKRPA